ncbi:MAG: hypothetical protein Q4D71_06005 [Oscillospiraceae bacterium]|nr:hypothetical protein [Oscillospiraceae bacterium]
MKELTLCMLQSVSSFASIVLIAVIVSGCASQQSFDTPTSTSPEKFDVVTDPPTPFSNIGWGASKEKVLSSVGQDPDDEYDNAGTHFIVFDGKKYEGYSGRLIYQLDDSGLYLIRFVYEGYEDKDVDYFVGTYTDKYGTGTEPYEYSYAWDTDKAYVFLTYNAMDSIIIEFSDPSKR